MNKHEREDDIQLIGCLRTSRPGTTVVVGATRDTCQRCGAEIWVSGSSREIAARGAVLACLECCVPEIHPDSPDRLEIAPMNEAQAYEILATLGSKEQN